MYTELQKLDNDSSIVLFFKILEQTGNDKMNSLFEFQNDLAHEFRQKNVQENFIKDKYLNKAFINVNELDLTDNYLENLNKIICVSGLSIPIVIYNYFLGANLNYAKLDRTARDITNDNQITQLYLQLNKALKFSEIGNPVNLEYEFEGEIVQIFDMNPVVDSLATINSMSKSIIRIQLSKNTFF